MKISASHLRRIIRKELLKEEKKEDVDLNVADLSFKIPPALQKLLDPTLSPQQFAKLDAQLDTKGTDAHQGFALAAFAMTYADTDAKKAKAILQKAMAWLPKIAKGLQE